MFVTWASNQYVYYLSRVCPVTKQKHQQQKYTLLRSAVFFSLPQAVESQSAAKNNSRSNYTDRIKPKTNASGENITDESKPVTIN